MRGHAKAIVGAVTLLLFLGAAAALADAPPAVTINSPSEVKYSSAQLSGEVDPEAGPSSTFWHFEYREASLPEEEASWSPVGGDQEIPAETEGSPTGPTNVAEGLGGLKPGTEYAVRLVAANEGGANRVLSAVKAFETDAVAKPEAKEVQASEVTASTAKLQGVVNSGGSGEGEAAGTYRFDCEPSCSGIGGEDEFAAEGFADGADHEITANATGLQPNTEYTLKLIARNAQSDAEGEAVTDQSTFTTGAIAPSVSPAPQGATTATETTLTAFVNPHHAALSDCHFEYGPTASYGQSVPCSPDPGAVNNAVLTGAQVSGLSAGTTYHYQVVAENQGGSAASGDRTFTTLSAPTSSACPNETRRIEEHATALPDCRAYELVSPVDKNGGDVMALADRTRASADGNAIQFSSLVGFGDARGSGISFDYLARRLGSPASQGWATHAITPALAPLPSGSQAVTAGFDQIYMGEFSTDLGQGAFLSATPLSAGSPFTEGAPNLYLRSDLLSPGAGSYRLISECPACTAPLPPGAINQPAIAGASADFHHILFESVQSLTAEVPPCDPGFGGNECPPQLYEWEDGTVRLAGILPASEGGGPAPSSQAGQGALNANSFSQRYTPNSISQDGSRIYFTVPQHGGSGQQYLRTANGTPGAATVRINASEASAPDPCQPTPMTCPDARYWTATPDGRYAFFTTREKLVDEDTSDPNLTELYRYDAEAPAGQHLTLVSPDLEDGGGASVFGVLGVSDDGAYVYFVSGQQIAPGGPSEDRPRIFVWHAGTVHQVSTVIDQIGVVDSGGWLSQAKLSRVSPDGTKVLFAIKGTAENPHTGVGDGCNEEGGCREVYLYDAVANAGAGRLACLSCHTPPSLPSEGGANFAIRLGRGLSGRTNHLNHPLTEDGRLAFFNTANRLLPEDTNGVDDVYSYDTQSGTLSLISSGTDPSGSYFLEASSDGSDVFFVTRARLLGWDGDQSLDLYDARVGGGFPEPAPEPAPCAGAGCRPGAAGAPAPPSAASATFAAPPERHRPRRPRKGRGRHRRKHHARHHAKRAAAANQRGAE